MTPAAPAPNTAPRGRLLILYRESRWAKLAIAVVVWTAFLVFVSFGVGPGSKLKRAVENAPMSCMAIGIMLATDARRRRGTTPRCAACDYDLSGAATDDAPPDARCPECGSLWNRSGMTVRGERVWSGRLFALAALLTLPFIAFTLIPLATGRFYTTRAVVAILPTGSLIEEVSRSRSFRNDAWAELAGRTLSATQHARLVRQLLERDALSLHAWSDEAKWLIAESAAGRMPPEEQGLMLRRFVGLKLQRQLSGPRDEWTVMREGAWGLAGAFNGWTLFAAVGEVKDASGATVQPPASDEIPLDLAKLAAPPTNYTNYAVPAWPGVWRGSGVSATVWLIAEPGARAAGPIEWLNGAPKVEPGAVVVRVELSATD